MKYETNPCQIHGICKIVPENKTEESLIWRLNKYLQSVSEDASEIVYGKNHKIEMMYLYRIDPKPI